MLEIIAKLYGPFFSVTNWETVLTSSSDWLIILSLVLIECLLSVDNAVVLAAQTQILSNKKWQEESLFYGLWGAYLFRFLIIGIGVYLISFWEIKVIGSVYLIYLAVKFFLPFNKQKSVYKLKKKGGKQTRGYFWWVVFQIECMDIVFSIDSVLASLAVSNNPVVVLIGGMIGILAMRGVAEVIMKLMKKIPELEPMAYVLIFLIAIKLFLSIPAIHVEIPADWFAALVFAVIIMTILYHYERKIGGSIHGKRNKQK